MIRRVHIRLGLLVLITILVWAPPSLCAEEKPDIRTMFDQARVYYSQGEFAKAIDVYERIIDLNPNFAEAFNALGMAYRAAGVDLREAAWYFKAAVEINPEYAEAYDNLGKAYYGLGDFDLAEHYCKKALEVNPRMISASFSLGWIYLLGKSKPAEAIPCFQRVADAAHLANAYFGLGMAYFMNDQRAEVLEVITKLRQIKEDPLATQLEDMVRGRRYVPGPPGHPLVAPERKESILVPSHRAEAFKESNAKTTPEKGDAQGLMRIRIKGKIIDLDGTEKEDGGSSPSRTSEERIRELQRYRKGIGIE